jgi:GNAT superfamily N-acetyltransferase
MYTVRNAMPDDALGITIVNVYTWKTAYHGILPETLLDERITDLLPRAEKCRQSILDGSKYVVAVDNGTIIAFCSFGACRNGQYADAGEVYALYTLAGYQGQGAGGALLNDAFQTLRAEGCLTVIVRCLRGNPALRFYERMGGRVAEPWEQEYLGYRMEGDVLLFTL